MEFDVLKEISNIGAGNATTAISTMMNLQVDMQGPVIKFLEFKELAEVIGGAENVVVGILLALQSDIDGMMMFVMEKKAAESIVDGILRHLPTSVSLRVFLIFRWIWRARSFRFPRSSTVK